jgi:hypothetical protein
MSQAKQLDDDIRDAIAKVNMEEIHPSDRLEIAIKFLEAVLHDTRAYESLLEQGYDDDDSHTGEPIALNWNSKDYV